MLIMDKLDLMKARVFTKKSDLHYLEWIEISMELAEKAIQENSTFGLETAGSHITHARDKLRSLTQTTTNPRLRDLCFEFMEVLWTWRAYTWTTYVDTSTIHEHFGHILDAWHTFKEKTCS